MKQVIHLFESLGINKKLKRMIDVSLYSTEYEEIRKVLAIS